MNAHEAQRLINGDMVEQLRHLNDAMTELAERYASQVVNHVLEVGTYTFGAAGVITRSWHLRAGCIEIDNPGTHTVTVLAGGDTGSVPTAGIGMYIVPAGGHRVIALASARVALYGTSGDTISLQAFTSAPRPVVT